jgi:hypothetical protein
LAGGKDDVPVIADCAKTSSICVGAPSSTIYMSWLAPNRFKLIFKRLRDFSTEALDTTIQRFRAWG